MPTNDTSLMAVSLREAGPLPGGETAVIRTWTVEVVTGGMVRVCMSLVSKSDWLTVVPSSKIQSTESTRTDGRRRTPSSRSR